MYTPYSATSQDWPAVPLPALAPDALGTYLAVLGLLRIGSAQWPDLRLCWRGESPVLVSGPEDFDQLVAALAATASASLWPGYKKAWSEAQLSSSDRNKKSAALRAWRAEAPEDLVPLFDAHIVATGTSCFYNPLLGTGGNSGKRNFAKGWAAASAKLSSLDPQEISEEAALYLNGSACRILGDFNAGSWFSAANKAYNSGTEKPYRNGQVSPFAMLLACAALPLLRGISSRRLGATARARGAFPFTTAPVAPATQSQCGESLGETWLPVWERPMALAEVRALFSRGRAAVNGRGAATAAAFATAALQRGVDAGIQGFCRFTLARTTSNQTFESRREPPVPVGSAPASGAPGRFNARSSAIGLLLDLRDSLRRDIREGDRWVYSGLQGGLDRALVTYAALPAPAHARALLDAAAEALGAAAKGAPSRKHGASLQLLPPAWLPDLLDASTPSTQEMRLARALAATVTRLKGDSSGTGRTIHRPFLAQLFGMNCRGERLRLAPDPPLWFQWSNSRSPTANLAAILRRSLVDAEPVSGVPISSPAFAPLADVLDLLAGRVDLAETERWLRRFSMFSLARAPAEGLPPAPIPVPTADADALSYGLLKLAFLPNWPRIRQRPPAQSPVRSGTCQTIATLISTGNIQAAADTATRAYRKAQLPVGTWPSCTSTADPDAISAALLVPVRPSEVAAIAERWLEPHRPQKGSSAP